MSNQVFDVVVVGSGPSGSIAAKELAANGVSVAIVEKEKLPRYKTCGGGIVYRAKKLLDINIDPVVEREFYKADLFLANENIHHAVIRQQPIISMTMRDKLDYYLTTLATDQGATLLEGHKVINISKNGAVQLKTSQGNIRAQFVIAADGVLSPIAKLAGWKETRHLIPALEFEVEVGAEDFRKLSGQVRFDIDAVPYGYAWSFPKEKHLSIGLASTKRGKLNLHDHYANYLKYLGINVILNETKHGYQIPLSPRKDGFFKNNILLTGDAAGFADPVTAEGISNAVLSGKLAAESIMEGKFNTEAVQRTYQQKLDSDLLPQLAIGRYLSKIFYGQKWLRKALFKRYGQELCEALTDVFMGDRFYPSTAKGKLKSFLATNLLKKI